MTDRIIFENETVVVLVREKVKPPAPAPAPKPAPPPVPPAHVSPLYGLVNEHRAGTGGQLLLVDAQASGGIGLPEIASK